MMNGEAMGVDASRIASRGEVWFMIAFDRLQVIYRFSAALR
jgi:hypothetical protein